MSLKWVIEQTADARLTSLDVQRVAERAGVSAFSVHINGPMISVLGSGFAVAEGVVTAKHVIQPVLIPGTGNTVPGASIRVRNLGTEEYRTTFARFVARDYDVALLALPEGVASLEWADSQTLTQGQDVIVLAAPNTLAETFVAYAAAGRITDLATVVPSLFRYSIPVQPGSSGGPVLILDGGGRVCGINLLQERQGARVVGVGLKANVVRAVLAGEALEDPRPILLPDGMTGTDALIVGGAAGAALYLLRSFLG